MKEILGGGLPWFIYGIENSTIDNSVDFIVGLLKKLRSEQEFIASAASMTQEAVNYILDT
jgi:hypothetical protein